MSPEPQGNNSAGENIQVFLRMRPLNQREISEEHAVSAWKIVDSASITMDSQLVSSSSRFVVPAGAYASLLAPTPSGQAKAYTFSKPLSHLLLARRLLQHRPAEH